MVGPKQAKGCSDSRPASAAAPNPTSMTLPWGRSRPQHAVSAACSKPMNFLCARSVPGKPAWNCMVLRTKEEA